MRHLPNSKPLTRKQRAVVNFIIRYTGEKGFSPTRIEIRKEFNISSKGAIDEMLLRIEAKGYIELIPYKWRGIVVLKED